MSLSYLENTDRSGNPTYSEICHKEDLTDVISGVYYRLSEYLEPGLYYLGVTPNMVTIGRIVALTTTIPLIYAGYTTLSATLVLVYYFGDCLDGHYARRYGMVSLWGDYLDHIADIFGYLILGWLLLPVLWPNYPMLLLLAIGLTLATVIEVSCEEQLKYALKEKGGSVGVVNEPVNRENCSLRFIHGLSYPEYNPLLSHNVCQNLRVLRWIGPGTLFLYFAILIFFYQSL